ncbi:MAG: substrate-binding domain-containing protein [Treponema sp.]|nr:substrate-binding domain-containing protein [Treponema sp.]
MIVQNEGNNLDDQKRQIHYLVEKGIDVLVVVPKNAEELSDSIQKIKAKNIPVVSYDRLLRNCDVDLYVTIDCYEVGRLMANGMLNVTNKRNWYCILGAKEDFNMSMVSTGLRQAITGRNISIDNIFYTDGWNYDLSYQHMLDLISSKKIPQVLICGNDAIASSVLQALREYRFNDHIPICGQDADIEACQNILRGRQDFTIYKPIMELAEKSAELAVELAKVKNAEKLEGVSETINNGAKDVPVFWLKPTLVDKNNIEDIIINSGFHSKSEIYQ